MTKSRFKTKLTKRQTRRNIQVFLSVALGAYAFVLLFIYGIVGYKGWTVADILLVDLALLFSVCSMLMFPVWIVSFIIGRQKGLAKRVRDNATFVPVQSIEYYRDTLDGLDPSLVSLLIDLDLYGKKDIAASLLRMQNKGSISFRENGSVTVAKQDMTKLDSSERELLSIIKNGKLNDKRVFEQWRQGRFRDAEKQGYIKMAAVNEEIDPKFAALMALSILAALALWAVFIHLGLWVSRTVRDVVIMHVMLAALDVLIWFPSYSLSKRTGYHKRGDVLWERTPLGHETAEKIAGLSRFIHEFSLLSEAKKEQVALWDDYLIYAIVLEENEQIVKDISRLYKSVPRGFDRLRSRLT